MQNQNRHILNGEWRIVVDPNGKGLKEKWFSSSWFKKHYHNSQSLMVPSNFNTIPSLHNFAGIVWYFKELPEGIKWNKLKQWYLNFQGVNYKTRVWLNGCELGSHEGGFLPFRFRIPHRCVQTQSSNLLVVQVNSNIFPDGIPGESKDWFNWGGIHRDVFLEFLPKSRLESVRIESSFSTPNPRKAVININLQIRQLEAYIKNAILQNIPPVINYELYYLQVVDQQDSISAKQYRKKKIQEGVFPINPKSDSSLNNLSFAPNSSEPTMQSYLPFQYSSTTNQRNFKIPISEPNLWSPDTPHLYKLELELSPAIHNISIRFGIRTISTHGHQLLLNHHPIRMQGASLHEEQVPYGRHYPEAFRLQEIRAMKKLGFNALRSAHYSHDELLCKICDEEGLLLLEEIPVYWNIQYRKRKVLKLAMKMIRDLIARDYNHPSVIVWSVGNEIPVENRDCRQFFRTLLAYTRKLDSSRLITYVSCRMCSDLLRRRTDVNCINFYFGWYYLSVYNLNFFLDAMYWTTHPNTPWMMTEFGAGAKYGVKDPEIKYSETNQARIITHQIKVLNSKPYIAGWFIWIYRDFKSSQRLNPYQQGFNRKGIVSEKNEPKLIARIMPTLLKQTFSHIHHYRILARFFGYFLRFLEWGVVKLIFMQEYSKEQKLVENYYKNTEKN